MPLALAGMALSLVGTGLSIAGGEKARGAMARTRAEFAAKEQENQRQSDALFQDNLSKNTPGKTSDVMKSGVAARTTAFDDLQKATTPIATALPAVQDASSPAVRAQARATTAADAWSKLVSGAQTKLAGYGDVQNQRGLDNAETSQKIGVLNDFSQGNARLMPIEMEVASQKGDKLSGWGNIVSSIGSLVGLAGATGAFSSAATAGGSWNAATDAWTGAAGDSLMNAPAGNIAAAFNPAATSDWLSSFHPTPVGGF